MIIGKDRERCLFAEEVINDKNKDRNHRKKAAINKKIHFNRKTVTSHMKYILDAKKKKKKKPTKIKKHGDIMKQLS